LFTINNKISKYDVGGIEYIHPDYVDGYKLNVEQTLYLTLENNVDGKRIQELPEVKSVNVIEVKEDKYILNEEEKDAIVVNLEWTYIEDYGYDTSANVTCLKIDDKMYIAQYAITE